MPDSGPPKRTLAEKLDHLFRTMHPKFRREYSYAEVVEGIQANNGPTISATYLWQLRKGLRDNPTKHHLEAIADFFGISPTYFFDDAATERINAELDFLVALRDSSVRHLALRAFGLSPESLRAITAIIENVRRLEGLPELDAQESAADQPPEQPAPEE